MEAYREAARFLVVEAFVGHGIGRNMHEKPAGTQFRQRAAPPRHRRLPPGGAGLVIAVEPMVNVGTKRVKTRADHWTQVTADGRPRPAHLSIRWP